MDLVERYLTAVDAQLPREVRADVIPELRDTLLSQLEEKEAELGRAPEHAEIETLLKAYGHPLVVAGRYRRHRQLIGPDVFPFYVVALQWTLGVVLAIQILIGVLGAFDVAAPIRAGERILDEVIPGLLASFAIVTIVFYFIDRAGGGAHLAASWSPRSLRGATPQRPGRSWEILFEMAFEAVFLLFWIGVITLPIGSAIASRSASLVLALNPIWGVLHTPVTVIVAASLAVNLVRLLRPGMLWPIAIARTGVTVASVVVVALLVCSGPIFELSASSRIAEVAPSAALWANLSVKAALVIVAVVGTLDTAGDVWRAWRGQTPAR